MYALAQAYGAVAGGLARNALVVGAETLSKIINWHDRSTCVLFGDGAGAVVIGRVPDGGFMGFELGADGEGGKELAIPGGGSRNPSTAETVAQEMQFLQMNGREVYRFATRVLVTSAEELLDEMRRSRSTTSTSTCRTRRTSGSSTTRPRSSASPRRRSS